MTQRDPERTDASIRTLALLVAIMQQEKHPSVEGPMRKRTFATARMQSIRA